MELTDLKLPWKVIDPKYAVAAVIELKKELGPRHPLKRKNVKAIANRCDCDDVLFYLMDEEPACAVVHLTHRNGEEPDPKWPFTRLFTSIEEWKRRCLTPDVEDYQAGELYS